MKRTAITLGQIADNQNLARAAQLAARGKRTRPDVRHFFHRFEYHLNRVAVAIYDGQLPTGRCRQFAIRDPKLRLIHAACFEDRVFHHAVMAHAGPVLDRALVPSSYACREGLGHHVAVQAVQRQLRCFPWFVKIDIQHYFDAIEHDRLLALLARRFKGQAFLALLQRVVAVYHTTPGRGLPIGSLTSKHFANYYLNGLDRYLLETLGVKAHVRYMDDILWWCPTQAQARESLAQAIAYAREQRGLTVKPTTQINRSACGVSFCGYRVKRGAILLSRRRRRRYQQLRRGWEQAYLAGEIDERGLQRAYAAVHAITLPADARGWRRENLRRFPALEV
ncbi:MAG: reverse transcriptase domain-containing protein [Candidatus Competibacterales bacterium]